MSYDLRIVRVEWDNTTEYDFWVIDDTTGYVGDRESYRVIVRTEGSPTLIPHSKAYLEAIHLIKERFPSAGFDGSFIIWMSAADKVVLDMLAEHRDMNF